MEVVIAVGVLVGVLVVIVVGVGGAWVRVVDVTVRTWLVLAVES